MKQGISLSAMALALSVGLPFSVSAQSERGVAEGLRGESGSPSAGIADIIVTAERRETTLQRTAAAISAVQGDEIRERRLNTIGDILQQTAAVVIQNNSKGQAVFIRGIGSTGDAQEGGDPAVNLNIDGVYQQQSAVGFANSLDVNRVEVLRGPQGTLYGRNSNAGSVNIITNDPVLGEASGAFNLQLGNYQALRVEAVGNVPLGNEVAGRIAFVSNRRDGYFSNGGASADGYAVRGKIKYEPTDSFKITLTGQWAQEDGYPQSTSQAPLNKDDPYNSAYTGIGYIPHGVREVRFGQIYAQADYDFGPATLTILPAYNYTRQYQDTILVPLQATAQETVEHARSIEARLASDPSSQVKWVVGLYGYSADDKRDPFAKPRIDFRHPDFIYPSDMLMAYGARSAAVFGQVTVPVTEKLRLTGGARYTKDRKTVDHRIYSDANNWTDGGRDKFNYSAATFKAGLEYDVAPVSLFYAQFSNGYKAGGINGNGSIYEPEKIKAYEAGIKNRFFGNRVQFNISAYYYDYDGYQALQTLPDCTAAIGFSVGNVNVAKLKNYGGEAELTVQPTGRDRFTATAAYLHSNGRFRYDGGICNASTGVVTHAYIDEVRSPPNSPRWSGTVGYAHDFDLSGGSKLTARADMRWSSSYDTTTSSTAFGRQGSFTRTDAALVWSLPDSRFSLSAFIRNIENKVQIMQTLAPPVPLVALQISEPQTYGISLGARF